MPGYNTTLLSATRANGEVELIARSPGKLEHYVTKGSRGCDTLMQDTSDLDRRGGQACGCSAQERGRRWQAGDHTDRGFLVRSGPAPSPSPHDEPDGTSGRVYQPDLDCHLAEAGLCSATCRIGVVVHSASLPCFTMGKAPNLWRKIDHQVYGQDPCRGRYVEMHADK